MQKAKYIYYPIVIALLLIVGVYIGARLKTYDNINKQLFSLKLLGSGNNKINQVLNYIQQEYVDTVDKEELTDNAIRNIVADLDPHSVYISKAELQAVNEPLQGEFDGIGVEFNILNDTIYVVSPIIGGPSEQLGILAGDKIIKVDGKNIAGIKITNNEVFKKLRGKSGTKVRVSILRKGKVKLIDFTITRGKIPLYSVDVSYMLNNKVGFIKISKFSATTYDEYMKAFHKLKLLGMQKLVLDLRGNPGGYLNEAADLADEFLEAGKMIVYTQGKARAREEYKATEKGEFEKNEVVVLVDEGSASASEIVSGALQDNDRGTVIGRRTFGKGLVQEQSSFPDGSAIRLTIARYYTPTGRCIQKPYEKGKQEDYYEEELERFKHGEYTNVDSVKLDKKQAFKTPKGKIVYGGGGVMPDIFVPLDTTDRSVLFTEMLYNGIVSQFILHYMEENRTNIKSFGSVTNYITKFTVTDKLYNDLIVFAKTKKIKYADKPLEVTKAKRLLSQQLKAIIARMVWGNDGFYPIIYSDDKIINKALEVLK